MPAAPIQPGAVLRPREVGAHSFIIPSRPTPDGRVVAVAWTTLDEQCRDDDCLLHPGDHPESRHASAVAFSRARLWDVSKIQRAIAADFIRELPPLPADVWARVLDAARRSAALRREWKPLLPAA